MIEQNGAMIHVESPKDRTTKSRFKVRGWVAADESVELVTFCSEGSGPLASCERPDVVRAYPARRFVRGFFGTGRDRDMGENGLRLVLQIGARTFETEHPLPASPPELPVFRRLAVTLKIAWLAWRARLALNRDKRWDFVLRRNLLQREARSNIFRRQHADALLADFARTITDAIFLQIGANDGLTGDPLHPFLSSADSRWRGVLVEPVPHVFAQLSERYGHRGSLSLENAAIAENDGTTIIYRIRTTPEDPLWVEHLASMDAEIVQRNALHYGNAADRIISENVPCLRVETLLRRHHLESVDLVVIDTEGSDWRILRQFDLNRLRPKLLLYEHQHLSASDCGEAHDFLERAGYQWAEMPEGDTIAWRRYSR